MKLNVRKANAAMCINAICFPKSGQILLKCKSKISLNSYPYIIESWDYTTWDEFSYFEKSLFKHLV